MENVKNRFCMVQKKERGRCCYFVRVEYVYCHFINLKYMYTTGNQPWQGIEQGTVSTSPLLAGTRMKLF
jgi:hypothetical protein